MAPSASGSTSSRASVSMPTPFKKSMPARTPMRSSSSTVGTFMDDAAVCLSVTMPRYLSPALRGDQPPKSVRTSLRKLVGR